MKSEKIFACHSRCQLAKCINDECFILAHQLMITGPSNNSHSYANPCEPWNYVNKADSVWKAFQGGLDMNNSNWIVGAATNIYNETHAVLLRPIK
jgi:hypothetical protein